jgi:hypothetical protein
MINLAMDMNVDWQQGTAYQDHLRVTEPVRNGQKALIDTSVTRFFQP